MIKSFKCCETEKLFNGKFSNKLPHNIQRTALRKLVQIHAATTLNFLRVLPANHLELLTGNRKDQFRICFKFENGDAFDVEIIDYH